MLPIVRHDLGWSNKGLKEVVGKLFLDPLCFLPILLLSLLCLSVLNLFPFLSFALIKVIDQCNIISIFSQLKWIWSYKRAVYLGTSSYCNKIFFLLQVPGCCSLFLRFSVEDLCSNENVVEYLYRIAGYISSSSSTVSIFREWGLLKNEKKNPFPNKDSHKTVNWKNGTPSPSRSIVISSRAWPFIIGNTLFPRSFHCLLRRYSSSSILVIVWVTMLRRFSIH